MKKAILSGLSVILASLSSYSANVGEKCGLDRNTVKAVYQQYTNQNDRLLILYNLCLQNEEMNKLNIETVVDEVEQEEIEIDSEKTEDESKKEIVEIKETQIKQKNNKDLATRLKEFKENNSNKIIEKKDIIEHLIEELTVLYSENKLGSINILYKQILNTDYNRDNSSLKTLSERYNFNIFKNKNRVISNFDLIDIETLITGTSILNTNKEKLKFLNDYKKIHEKIELLTQKFYNNLFLASRNNNLLNKIAPELNGTVFKHEYSRDEVIGLSKLINHIQTKMTGIKSPRGEKSIAHLSAFAKQKPIADCDSLSTKFYLDTFYLLNINNAFIKLIQTKEYNITHVMPCLEYGDKTFCIESTLNNVTDQNEFIIGEQNISSSDKLINFPPFQKKLPYNIKLNEIDFARLYLDVTRSDLPSQNIFITNLVNDNFNSKKDKHIFFLSKELLNYHNLIDFVHKEVSINNDDIVNKQLFKTLVYGLKQYDELKCGNDNQISDLKIIEVMIDLEEEYSMNPNLKDLKKFYNNYYPKNKEGVEALLTTYACPPF